MYTYMYCIPLLYSKVQSNFTIVMLAVSSKNLTILRL